MDNRIACSWHYLWLWFLIWIYTPHPYPFPHSRLQVTFIFVSSVIIYYRYPFSPVVVQKPNVPRNSPSLSIFPLFPAPSCCSLRAGIVGGSTVMNSPRGLIVTHQSQRPNWPVWDNIGGYPTEVPLWVDKVWRVIYSDLVRACSDWSGPREILYSFLSQEDRLL